MSTGSALSRRGRCGSARLLTSRGEVEFSVVVEALADKRGPAAVAQTLYQETEQSIARQVAAAAQEKHSVNYVPPLLADRGNANAANFPT